MRKIGYARVPYTDQNLDNEITHLLINGCDLVFSEKVNVYSKEQIELKNCLEELKENDILVITDLKALGLTPKQFINFLEYEIISKNFHLEVLNLDINTQNATRIRKSSSTRENIKWFKCCSRKRSKRRTASKN